MDYVMTQLQAQSALTGHLTENVPTIVWSHDRSKNYIDPHTPLPAGSAVTLEWVRSFLPNLRDGDARPIPGAPLVHQYIAYGFDSRGKYRSADVVLTQLRDVVCVNFDISGK